MPVNYYKKKKYFTHIYILFFFNVLIQWTKIFFSSDMWHVFSAVSLLPTWYYIAIGCTIKYECIVLNVLHIAICGLSMFIITRLS